MLQNPIHLRLEKLESWPHVTFMASLCERMYPNYAMFCKQTGFGDPQLYRRILDLIWETVCQVKRWSTRSKSASPQSPPLRCSK